jgi:Ca-activated chloride channel family protein
VVQAWHSVIVNQVARLNRSGDRRQARHFLERELKYFERYARDLPGGAEQVRTLVLMLQRVGDDWNERTRKEMMFESYRLAESRVDHRRSAKESWADRLSRS